MKEFFNRGIEWISKNSFVEKLSESEFTRGIIIGFIAGVVFLLLVRFILWLCMHKKSCPAIEIRNSSGLITIRTAAIAGVLKAAVKPLESLIINKVKLFRNKKQFDIYLGASFDPAKGAMPQLMKELNTIVREQMKNVFGVDNINEVHLNVVSCKKDSAGSVDQDQEQDDKNVVVDDNGFANSISIKPPIEK